MHGTMNGFYQCKLCWKNVNSNCRSSHHTEKHENIPFKSSYYVYVEKSAEHCLICNERIIPDQLYVHHIEAHPKIPIEQNPAAMELHPIKCIHCDNQMAKKYMPAHIQRKHKNKIKQIKIQQIKIQQIKKQQTTKHCPHCRNKMPMSALAPHIRRKHPEAITINKLNAKDSVQKVNRKSDKSSVRLSETVSKGVPITINNYLQRNRILTIGQLAYKRSYDQIQDDCSDTSATEQPKQKMMKTRLKDRIEICTCCDLPRLCVTVGSVEDELDRCVFCNEIIVDAEDHIKNQKCTRFPYAEFFS